MTLYELRLRRKAYQRKERDMHWQAWLIAMAQATKQQGKSIVPVFRSFDRFYQTEEQKEPSKEAIARIEILKRQKERRNRHGQL